MEANVCKCNFYYNTASSYIETVTVMQDDPKELSEPVESPEKPCTQVYPMGEHWHTFCKSKCSQIGWG